MITLNGVTLPYDLVWKNEFDWVQTNYKVKPTLGNTVTVTSSTVIGNSGRRINLEADYAWAFRDDVTAISDMLNTVTSPMLLQLHDNRQFIVVLGEGGFSATPLNEDPEPNAKTPYRLSFSLIVVQ